MKKFYVWGTGPVQSALIREAEPSLKAAEVAMEKGFSFGTTGDDWAVEVEATEEEIDEATRFDPAVAGYVGAELTKVLTDDQFQRAYALAKWHGHEWASILPPGSPLRKVSDIAAVVCEANKETVIPYIEAPTLEHNVVVHTSGTGRVSWSIHPDGTVNITISRPGGAALWGILSPNGTLTCGEVIGGVKFAGRHRFALKQCFHALELFIDGWVPYIPEATLTTWEVRCDLGYFRRFIVDIPNTYGYEAEVVGRILYERIADIINMLEKDSSATGTFGLDGLTWHWRANREGDVCITTY